MKAEHRKELQTNALADRIGKFLQGLKARPSSSSTIIWVFIILAGGWWYFSRASERSRSEQWRMIDEVSNLDQLDSLIQEHPSSLPTRVARFEKARFLMHQGEANLYSPTKRKDAAEKIKEAG